MIVLLIIGFPISLLLAYAYEVTPEGIKKTKEVPLSESITHLTGKKLNYILAGVIVLGLAYIVFDKFYLDRRATESEMVSTESNQVPAASDVEKAKKTIAVLPFTDLSPEKDQEYFVDGLSEELLNTLTQIPDLLVTGRTSSFSFKGSNKTVQEIASILGVENILEGSVRKAGNQLRVTAQLLRGADGFHLWSDSYDRELKVKDIFAVQEDIAKAVANELKTTLGISKYLKQLGGTENLEAYELYLVAKGLNWDDPATISRALELVDKAIALDNSFALAWVLKATLHSINSIEVPINRFDSELDICRRAALKAIELEPNLGDAYASLGDYKTAKGEWVEAEVAYRKTLELSTASFMKIWSYRYLLSVGSFKRADEALKEAIRNDPLDQMTRTYYMLNLGYLGEIGRAEQEYERGKILFEGNSWIYGDFYIAGLLLGSGNILKLDKIAEKLSARPIWTISRNQLKYPENGRSELHQYYDGNDDLSLEELMDISVWAAYFGDTELALDSLEKGIILSEDTTHIAWFPVFHEVRQTPRFKLLMKKIGLVDYWNKFGWPDICHQLDNGDFECD